MTVLVARSKKMDDLT